MSQKLILVCIIFTLSFPVLFAQTAYHFFQSSGDFAFLKDIEEKIEIARQNQDVQGLSVYSSLLFYTQYMTGRRYEYCDGLKVFSIAKEIVYAQQNVAELENLAKMAENKIFGPNNFVMAEEIRAFRRYCLENNNPIPNPQPNIERPITPPPPGWPTSRDILRAREFARVNALEQVAEQIFGILIRSISKTHNFELIHDEVIATLKADLMAGAIFGEGRSRLQGNSYEIEIPVTVKKNSIISSVRAVLSRQKKTMTDGERRNLENSLQEEYKATGLGIISPK